MKNIIFPRSNAALLTLALLAFLLHSAPGAFADWSWDPVFSLWTTTPGDIFNGPAILADGGGQPSYYVACCSIPDNTGQTALDSAYGYDTGNWADVFAALGTGYNNPAGGGGGGGSTSPADDALTTFGFLKDSALNMLLVFGAIPVVAVIAKVLFRIFGRLF